MWSRVRRARRSPSSSHGRCQAARPWHQRACRRSQNSPCQRRHQSRRPHRLRHLRSTHRRARRQHRRSFRLLRHRRWRRRRSQAESRPARCHSRKSSIRHSSRQSCSRSRRCSSRTRSIGSIKRHAGAATRRACRHRRRARRMVWSRPRELPPRCRIALRGNRLPASRHHRYYLRRPRSLGTSRLHHHCLRGRRRRRVLRRATPPCHRRRRHRHPRRRRKKCRRPRLQGNWRSPRSPRGHHRQACLRMPPPPAHRRRQRSARPGGPHPTAARVQTAMAFEPARLVVSPLRLCRASMGERPDCTSIQAG